MINITIPTELKGKFITLGVNITYRDSTVRRHFYHGTLVDVNDKTIIIDDILEGKQEFAVETIVSIHPTTRMELIEMEKKMDNIEWKLKSERIDMNTSELRAKLRKQLGLD